MSERSPIRKVLVANRGEIAVRVMRTCREMGLRTVAVYSDADRGALHVRLADEAVHLGPSIARESYLSPGRLLAAAERTGADAVHPGYGFLSERPDFNRACREAGLVFVGPPPESQEAMGVKTSARARMKAAGVPVVPGSDGPIATEAEARALANAIGYPVMIKAAAGGGGKGMKRCDRAEDLGKLWQTAQRESLSAFGDDRLYLERFLDRPRHVEVQVFADEHGRTVWLGERECSIQRRHQKIVEEAPAQDEVIRRGHAVEARVYAEDPARGFLPSPGKITYLRVPGGPGIRDDSGVYGGWVVSQFYDPLISKLIAWAPTRAQAIDRLRRALGDYHVHGISTNTHYLRAVLDHPAFRAGDYDTGFCTAHQKELLPAPDRSLEEVALVAAAVAAFQRDHDRAEELAARAGIVQAARSGWAHQGRLRALRGGAR
jgi:acetyl/propionyl-CoA carboxylase alpha subunit